MLIPIVATLLLGTRMVLSAPPISVLTGTPRDMTTYCNAPHVLASQYKVPNEDAELVHVSVFMRHHKVIDLSRCAFFRLSRLKRLQRAPAYLVPNEREINVELGWNCSGVKQFKYNGGGARLYHEVTTPPGHPFAREIWAGTCEVGQLTHGGFRNSKTHGKVKHYLYALVNQH